MFNLNAVVVAFNLTPVEAGSFQDKYGFVFIYRPVFHKLDNMYGTSVASTSYIDAEDLFYSLVSYNELNLETTVTKSMTDLLARLVKVQFDYKDYHVDELCDFLTKYEDRHSTHTYDEVRFFGMLRQELVEEAFRVGSEYACLAAIYNRVDEAMFYRNQYNEA